MLADDVKRLEDENRRMKEELKVLKGEGEKKKPRICRYCKHYNQHYSKTNGVYHEIYCGHCMNGQRLKGRKPDQSCEYFEFKSN